MSPFRRCEREEHGFVLVWFALIMVLLLGVAAFTVDILHAYSAAEGAQNTADAASLGGVVLMPDFPDADALARSVAANNIDMSSSTITPQATLEDNQLRVTVETEIDTFFARVLGFPTIDITRTAVAEYDAPTPLDLVLIIDRTSSMTTADMANVKDAANDLLEFLDPSNEHIALGVTPPSTTSFQCTSGSGLPGYGRATTYAGTNTLVAPYSWMVAPYGSVNLAPVSDYKNADETLNTNSQIVKTIACLERATIGTWHTNLGTPIDAAVKYLQANGRPGARQGIILMTDGEANQTNLATATPMPCQWAATNAQIAKDAGIQMLTIGFGVEGATCTRDTPAAYQGVTATRTLANMASPMDGVPADDDGCTQAENQDGDNFFCQPGTGDLSNVFVQAASQLAGRSSRLVK